MMIIEVGFFLKGKSVTTTDSNVNWISATGSGHVIIVSEYPYVPDAAVSGNVSILRHTKIAGILSVWGAIISPASSAGFAMEFIGDSTDSTTQTDGDDAGAL